MSVQQETGTAPAIPQQKSHSKRRVKAILLLTTVSAQGLYQYYLANSLYCILLPVRPLPAYRSHHVPHHILPIHPHKLPAAAPNQTDPSAPVRQPQSQARNGLTYPPARPHNSRQNAPRTRTHHHPKPPSPALQRRLPLRPLPPRQPRPPRPRLQRRTSAHAVLHALH